MFLKAVYFSANTVLGDFGIAKDLGMQGDFAKTFLGTPYFMSPGFASKFVKFFQ